MKNKLTLKSLQHELNLIKAQKLLDENRNKSNTKSPLYKSLFQKSSMFHLWLITGVLGYARKIPLISKVLSLLSLWYGKTTWWKILVKTRKAFIVFNAIIGVLMVYKTVGFSPDNLFAGFSAMGYTYIEMFTSMTKRLFNWFVELFDHKVVPNIPGDNNPKTHFWSPKGIDFSWNNKLPKLENIPNEWINKPFNVNVNTSSIPWYKDLSTWLWIGGIITVAFIGYKLFLDPLFIDNLPTPKGKAPEYPAPTSPDITLTGRVVKTAGDFSKSIYNGFTRFRNNINPFNWLIGTNDLSNQFQTFMEKQNDMVTADRRYYPFTEINPTLSWYQQLKIQLLGESLSESLQRFKDREFAERVYSSLQVSKGKFTNVAGLTPYTSGTNSVATTVGFGVHNQFPSFIESIQSINIENKLNSIPSTPITIHKPIPGEFLETVGGSLQEWNNHERAPYTDDWFKSIKSGKVATSSKVTLDDIPVHYNKFSVLENIDI
jgi:hypothetical protein